MTDYKPGVYKATVADVPDQIVVWHLDGGCTPTVSVDTACLQADDVTDMRPLVVLDLPNPQRVAEALRAGAKHAAWVAGADLLLSMLADQIEAQTKPPKPAEPTGLGAVIEDSEGHLWVRAGSDAHVALKNCWRATAGEYVGDWQTFDRIDVVRVLSEGVA